jgi:hypothetical protein
MSFKLGFQMAGFLTVKCLLISAVILYSIVIEKKEIMEM